MIRAIAPTHTMLDYMVGAFSRQFGAEEAESWMLIEMKKWQISPPKEFNLPAEDIYALLLNANDSNIDAKVESLIKSCTVPYKPTNFVFNLMVHSATAVGNMDAAARVYMRMIKGGLNTDNSDSNKATLSNSLISNEEDGFKDIKIGEYDVYDAMDTRTTIGRNSINCIENRSIDVKSENFMRESAAGAADNKTLAPKVSKITADQTLIDITKTTPTDQKMGQATTISTESGFHGLHMDHKGYTLLIWGYVRRRDMDKATEVFNQLKRRMGRPWLEDYENMIFGHLDVLKPANDRSRWTSRLTETDDRDGVDFLEASADGVSKDWLAKRQKSRLWPQRNIEDKSSVDDNTAAAKTGTVGSESLDRVVSDLKCFPDGSEDKESVIKKNIDVVRGYFREMQEYGIMPSLKLYDMLMNAHIYLDENEKAISIFERILENNMVPDVRVFTSLVVALCNLGDWECAVSTVAAMRQQGIKPDVVIYTVLLNSHGKRGNLKAMEAVYDEMVSEGLQPTPTTYGSLLNSYCRVGDIDSAHSVLKRLHDAGFVTNTIHYNSLILGYGTVHDLESCKRTFEQMCSEGILPSTFTYNILIAAHIRRGDIEGALMWYEAMISVDGFGKWRNLSQMNHHQDEYDQGTTVQWHKKKSFLKKMSSPLGMRLREPNLVTFNTLVWAQARRLDENGVSRAIEYLLRNGFRPDLSTFIPLLECVARKQNLDEAWGIVSKLEMMAKGSLDASDSALPSIEGPDTIERNADVDTSATSAEGQKIHVKRSSHGGVTRFDASAP
jgi:pentatricopeptide repeat protein